jgi:hypothetical protein
VRRFCLFVLLLSLGVAATGKARAQSVDDIASQLSERDVVVSQEALRRVGSGDLERTVAGLQEEAAFFKVVVLGAPVDGQSPRSFARDVLARLGSAGRVAVYTPDEVGIASSVDRLSDVALAESAAARALSGGSVAASVRAGGTALAGGSGELLPGPARPAPGVTTPTRDVPDGGRVIGGGLLLLLLFFGMFLLLPLLLFFAFTRLVRRATAPPAEEVEPAVALGEGERKVRQAVDRGGNLIIDLSDRIDVPDVPAEALEAFRAGARGFTQVHDELEHADTRDELEDIYPRIVDAVWQLETAAALLDGKPAPPRPEPEPLFPRRERAEYEELPSYTVFGASPFFTETAMTALGLLGSRGHFFTSHRSAMDDDEFWQLFDASFPFEDGGTRTRQPTWRDP